MFKCAMEKSLRDFFYYLCEFKLFSITISIVFLLIYCQNAILVLKSKSYFQKIITLELKSVMLVLGNYNRKMRKILWH